MMSFFRFLITLSALCWRVVVLENTDGVFTSSVDLVRLVRTESEVTESLKAYVIEEQKKLDKIRRLVQAFDDMSVQAMKDPEAFVASPINSYLLIKRLSKDFANLHKLIIEDSTPETLFLRNFTLMRDFSSLLWPEDSDLCGASAALLRLQDTYRLTENDMSLGVLNGRFYGLTMNAHDAFELGRQAVYIGDTYHGYVWLAQAYYMLMWEGEHSVDPAELVEWTAWNHYLMGNYEHAIRLTNTLKVLNPEHSAIASNLNLFRTKIIEVEAGGGSASAHELTPPPEEDGTYQSLCRNEVKPPPRVTDKLKCQYNFGRLDHPFFKIGPLKEEEVYLEPRLVVYHDVLGNDTIEVIKALAKPKFVRSTVHDSGRLVPADYRISKVAWLENYVTHPVVDKIFKTVGAFTGLQMNSSEMMQVSNYGIGGHYSAHYDYSRMKDNDTSFAYYHQGNRMATWLFYLSDVDQGGATVFPDINVSLWPKSGRATLWYNLKRSGEGDDYVRHAACPVLTGDKWVSTFWIHERGQEFRRPCSIDEGE